ncbi:hypothetical protein ACHAXT_011634 [Thalassiosira profunda]
MQPFLRALLAAATFASALLAASAGDDLYAILGIQRSATIKEIKSAYRKKARDTHPDKNTDVPTDEATEAFRKVAHAFEVLSDAGSRRRYDQTGNDSGGGSTHQNRRGGGGGGWTSFHGKFYFHSGPPPKMKDKPEVKQAQSRILHVVSLEQLRTIMLDDNDKLERNLLICFYTPRLEELVEDEMVYPYPFAGMSAQSIWWEDLLQTTSVRFHRSNELMRYFNIDISGEDMKEPLFLFANRGAELPEEGGNFEWTDDKHGNVTPDRQFFLHRTTNRGSFEGWVWRMIEVKVVFNNRHAHPVELYWLNGRRAEITQTIDPHSTVAHYSKLTHEFYTRDARVDKWDGSPGRWKLSPNSSLGRWKIGVEGEEGAPVGEDGTVVIDIPSLGCIDLSGHCGFWEQQRQCNENPGFMREKCELTCGHCNNDTEEQVCTD